MNLKRNIFVLVGLLFPFSVFAHCGYVENRFVSCYTPIYLSVILWIVTFFLVGFRMKKVYKSNSNKERRNVYLFLLFLLGISVLCVVPILSIYVSYWLSFPAQAIEGFFCEDILDGSFCRWLHWM